MQFCTIDEAWGSKNNHNDNQKKIVTENFNIDDKESENSTEVSLIKEKFQNNKKPKKIYFNHTEESLYEGFTDTINDRHEREKLLSRVLKSRRCRNVLRKKFQPNLMNKLHMILDDYRDLIVLVLIGFCIVIFLKMLYNISK